MTYTLALLFLVNLLNFFDRTVPAGSDAPAKAKVGELIDKLGFFGVDLGLLGEGGRAINIPGGALPILNLVRLD